MDCEELGVSVHLSYEDPRYPTLILESEQFGIRGWSLDLASGDLRRVCICAARSSSECICGAWDAAGS